MHAYILLSTVLCFLAVLLGALSIGPAWDAVARRYVADLIPKFEAVGLDSRQIDRYMRWWGIAIFATLFTLGVVAQMIPVALGAAYLVFVSPRYFLEWRTNRRRILLRDQMVRASVALANSARAGLSQAQGLELIAQDSPEPLAAEFRRIVNDYNAGRPLAEAINEVQQRLDLEAFSVFSAVLQVCMERGGNIAFALERISTNLQELQRLGRKLEANTASGRRVTLILGIFPIVFLFGFTLLDPSMMVHLYTTQMGQFILLGVGVLVFAAVRWCSAILNLDF